MGLPANLNCKFLNKPLKGNPMKVETRIERTPLRMRAGIDTSGNQYALQEWRVLVSVKELAGWSAWAPFNQHGQAMTCKGVELERISSTQWTLGEPPLALTLLE